MKSSIKLSTYKVTSDNDLHNERYGITRELSDQFEKLHARTLNRKDKKIIDTLNTLITKYPNAPQLKNFLSVAYHVRGDRDKAKEFNQWTLDQHPDYLFGKLNLAVSYIDKGEYAKVPEILGELMEIKNLYPDRDEFHIGELTAFYKIAVLYFTSIKNHELAENRFKILADLAPDHPDTIDAESYLYPLRLQKARERYERNKETAIRVSPSIPIPDSFKTEAPVFTHDEINDLYRYGLDLTLGKTDTILLLSVDTLQSDLEKVLQDAVDRFNYFLDKDWAEEIHSFPLHAICLLGELKAGKSLPAVFQFLSQHEEVIEFWLGDHLTETIWQPVYNMAMHQPELLKAFCLRPGVHAFAKTVASETLAQIALHHPERRNEIALLFKEILQGFYHASLSDNLIDSEFLGLCIADILDSGFGELLPEITALYEIGYVSDEVNGSLAEVIEFFDSPDSISKKRELLGMVELYDDVILKWSGFVEDPDFDEDFHQHLTKPSPVTVVKIGRNDPCPCGSGKKFKKCCIDVWKN
jgi:hypothetical protein